jgi:hypothetical protein
MLPKVALLNLNKHYEVHLKITQKNII